MRIFREIQLAFLIIYSKIFSWHFRILSKTVNSKLITKFFNYKIFIYRTNGLGRLKKFLAITKKKLVYNYMRCLPYTRHSITCALKKVIYSLLLTVKVCIDVIKNYIFKLPTYIFSRAEAYLKCTCIEQLERSIKVISNQDITENCFYKNSIRLIAFYLPQFHTISENDEWWGEGFTEWVNVKKAKPLFNGHYQPHIPLDGYYDLRNIESQKRQVKLAKQHGLGGFCFYFYWFKGKTLLEEPVRQYLNEPSLDLPFCLCWANENWTRTWDGLEKNILIAQNHSDEDDIEFIKYISVYLQDSRYIRINGRPLLLVYSPDKFPEVKRTASLWRDWCRKNGIGEIYLAYTQADLEEEPYKYGFDAAIDFPPRIPSTIRSSIGTCELGYSGHFGMSENQGTLFDWNKLVEASKCQMKRKYRMFLTVNPGWDNTPRRPNNAHIQLGNSPYAYQKWLQDASEWTLSNSENSDDNLVFVNAWNEWGEGAHLEPDLKNGYAYLESTRIALLKAEINYSATCETIDQDRLAIVIHVFYVDLLEGMLDKIKKINLSVKIYITTMTKYEQVVQRLLIKYEIDFYILTVSNRGRDILPFIKIMPYVVRDGYKVVLKLHTKQSTHRRDGNIWRQNMVNSLTAPHISSTVLNYLAGNKDIGIIGPDQYIVPLSAFIGSNFNILTDIAYRIGLKLNEEVINTTNFIAGTMFYCRVSSISPLLNLRISEEDFDIEQGQLDGTLAHVFERTFSLSAMSVGQKVITTTQMLL